MWFSFIVIIFTTIVVRCIKSPPCRLLPPYIKIGYYVGYVEFSIKSQVDGRLIARGSQNKFLPTGKYPKLWALAAKCTPLVAAVFNRDFAQKWLDPESWSGLLSVDGQRLHFEDLFASNGEGKMVCTPKTQNWNHILQGMESCSTLHQHQWPLQYFYLLRRHDVTTLTVTCRLEFYLTSLSLYLGGAAISSAEQFLMEKEDGSSYTGSDDPQLSYFQISYFQPIGLGEGYNLKLDDSTLDMHKNMASTVSLLNQSGKMACHIHCLRYS